MPSKKNDIAWRRILRHWHRRAGAFSALILLPIAITGIPLNHASELGLDQQYTPALMARMVGHQVLPPKSGFQITENQWVSQCERHIYLNEQPLFRSQTELVGAELIDGILLVAEPAALHLLDAESGELIESIPAASLPVTIRGLSVVENRLHLHGPHRVAVANEDFLAFETAAASSSQARLASTLSGELASNIAAIELGHSLSWTNFLTILHSGQIFGQFGRYLTDLAGLALIYLALSGSWLWFRAARRHGA